MTDPWPSGPAVRCPPPVLFLLGIVAGWWFERAHPLPLIGAPARPAGVLAGSLLVALGVGLTALAVTTFRGAGTAIIPNRRASTLVTHGPYRWSRNPMYLGLALAYLGIVLAMNSVWMLLFLPLVMA